MEVCGITGKRGLTESTMEVFADEQLGAWVKDAGVTLGFVKGIICEVSATHCWVQSRQTSFQLVLLNTRNRRLAVKQFIFCHDTM